MTDILLPTFPSPDLPFPPFSMYPTRPIPMAKHGMVACPHHLASAVGLRILQQGGNAIDAAIAVNSTLGVVYPHMTGIGGDSFWLIYEAKSGKLFGLNGSGRSGKSATRDFYYNQGFTVLPSRGPLAAITVPGTVDAWAVAQKRFGQLTLAEVLQPAIAYAKEGYPVSASQEKWTAQNFELLSEYGFSQRTFLPDGQVPQVGTILTNLGLANTLEAIATHGPDIFYRGEIAQTITDYLAKLGGILTPEDFASHQSDWVEAIATQYRGKTIYQMPPNTQGFTVLQILNLIEGFDLQKIGHDTADYYHLLIEATKLAFADRDRWLTDPTFAEIPIQHLISKEYAEQRRSLINMQQAGDYKPGIMGGDTTYSAIVDAAGNAVSMIQSIYYDYGCGVVAGETGVILQNRGSFFSLNENHINRLEPAKRTFHTLIPAMVMDKDKPLIIFGTMGGEGQPQTQVALLTRILDFGFNLQSAIDLPRWLYGRTWGSASSKLSLENCISVEAQNQLMQRGHPVEITDPWCDAMGHAHAIKIDAQTGVLSGGSDPRSDGIALGW